MLKNPNPAEHAGMSMYASSADYWKAQAEKAQREAAEWRQNFEVLQRALVGETGASGITVAAAMRKDAERYRWLKTKPTWLGWDADFQPDEIEREVDAAMLAEPAVGAA